MIRISVAAPVKHHHALRQESNSSESRLFLAGCVFPSVVATKIDLETTFPLSPDTFWRLAQSEDIFRNSRVQARFMRQRVSFKIQ